MKLRTLAAVVVAAAAGGCTSAPAVSHPPPQPAGYWTEARLGPEVEQLYRQAVAGEAPATS